MEDYEMSYYDMELYKRFVANQNEKAKEFLICAKLLGRGMDLNNKDEIIAGLYTALTTKLYPNIDILHS